MAMSTIISASSIRLALEPWLCMAGNILRTPGEELRLFRPGCRHMRWLPVGRAEPQATGERCVPVAVRLDGAGVRPCRQRVAQRRRRACVRVGEVRPGNDGVAILLAVERTTDAYTARNL